MTEEKLPAPDLADEAQDDDIPEVENDPVEEPGEDDPTSSPEPVTEG